MSLRSTLFSVMMLITIVPLILHIVTINHYSQKMIESDLQQKEKLARKMISMVISGQQRDSVALISHMIMGDQDFESNYLNRDRDKFNQYLKGKYSEDYIAKSGVKILEIQAFDENNHLIGSAINGESGVDERVIGNLLATYDDKAEVSNANFEDYFRGSQSNEPIYITVSQVQAQNYKGKLVIMASAWEKIVGFSETLQADVDIFGMNGEVFFREIRLIIQKCRFQ
jgi:hypothetical protein